jgi:F-type H+-transporting ATPase subunit a
MFKNYYVGAATVIGVVLMSLLELFVAFLQAYIFTFLTTIFIGFAVKPEH